MSGKERREKAIDVVIIRSFGPGDEEEVISLWRKCDLVRSWNDPKRDIQRKLKVRPDLFLVGTVDNRIVATVMVGYEGYRGWINYLAVDPDHQHRGYGRAIMAKAEILLRAEECPKINLQIRATRYFRELCTWKRKACAF